MFAGVEMVFDVLVLMAFTRETKAEMSIYPYHNQIENLSFSVSSLCGAAIHCHSHMHDASAETVRRTVQSLGFFARFN